MSNRDRLFQKVKGFALSTFALTQLIACSGGFKGASTDAASGTSLSSTSGPAIPPKVPGIPPVTGPSTTPPTVTTAGTGMTALSALPAVAQPTPAMGQNVLTVGAGQTYLHLVDAANAAQAGDIVEIMTSLDNESAAFLKDVKIWCKPGVVLTWSAGTNQRMAWGKGFFVFDQLAQNVEIDNCETVGAVVAGSGASANGAGARIAAGVQNIILSSVNFHDGNNGVLIDGGSANVQIINSKFYNNGLGGDGHTHNIYVGNVPSVTATNSYFGPVFMGNIFKSRAQKTTLVSDTFDSQGQDGGSYEIDIPNCGQVRVANSVIEKSAMAPQHYVLSYGSEGCAADARVNAYEMTQSVMISDASGSNFINFGGGMAVSNLNLHDTKIVGPVGGVPAGTNLQILTDRTAAGLMAAPALPPTP